jgi:hypothetical protein
MTDDSVDHMDNLDLFGIQAYVGEWASKIEVWMVVVNNHHSHDKVLLHNWVGVAVDIVVEVRYY